MNVRYSYLKQQFENADDLWDNLKEFVSTGDFTLGKPLEVFENSFGRKFENHDRRCCQFCRILFRAVVHARTSDTQGELWDWADKLG